MKTSFTLKARWIVPVEGEPIAGGNVTVHDGKIAAVNDSAAAVEPIEDLGDVVLLPGLVNAHTHLEFSDLSAPLGKPGTPLPDWIRQVIAARKRDSRSAQANVNAGLSESLRHGVAALGDIATAAAKAQTESPATVSFQEVIGFSAGRIDSAASEVLDRVELSDGPGISPHAPYTVHPQLLKRLVDEAVKRALPVAMHLAESREELQLLADGSGSFRDLLEERSMWDADAIPLGTKPLDYLQVLRSATRAVVVHGNYLSDDEIDFLVGHRERMSLVYCPRTHEYFGHDFYPLRKMLDAGVHLALGTDSRASSPDLSLLAEMRTAYCRHELDPVAAVRLGTLAGAECLGLQHLCGSIVSGKRADLLALPCPGDDPYAFLDTDSDPTHVWLAGRGIR